MSDEGSLNIQKLRDFRLQRKPQFSHNSTDELDTSNSNNNSGDPKPVARRRIIVPPSDSDSEQEARDRETNSSTVDTNLQNTVDTNLENTEDTNPQEIVIANNSLFNSKYNGYSQRAMKNPSILEKEKQMKFLLEIFPNLDAMQIHDCLSKHSFNTDAAAAELSRMYNKSTQLGYTGYNEWRQDYDRREAESRKSQIANAVLYEQQQSFKRKASDDVSVTKKKKRRSYDSEDSAGSGHFRDKRVFDSDEDSDVEISNELTGDKKKVFEFFNTATVNELQLMASCSKKRRS
ncbi:hypothetical protein NQ317_008669 [Molorchus minor]|uniref:CUE domain-containing protein n=1 Tax=Molorchus minor TaxID=1323400 RepID=A0ABQ9K1L0_9CUCU|nr:hypothetical protein NQ317_008669 [Molorchus minor]